MDLTAKGMYDTIKDEVWKELGPLDPDWFDSLTFQTFPKEGNVSSQDDVCANQERNFKTPFDTTAVDSQLFSTPRVFRHSRLVSPEAENDQSFTNEKEKETLPWTATQSPNLFQMSKEGVPAATYGGMQPQSEDSFDFLHTPLKVPVSYAKEISESLSAQFHSDISWTSSLNTPPAVPSTLILSKTDESPCPLSVSADKNVVIVRKLFPSLSNANKTGASLPKNTGVPAFHQGLVSLVTDHNSESHDSPEISLNQSEGVWRQKLPDATEDGEIRSTVANVLEGPESVLSIFFTNSNSALRKVKTERNKRKQIILTKEKDCSATDISTANNTASTEQKTDDQEPGECFLSPVGKAVATGISQWSPLSLSEIPPCTVDTLCHDNSPAKQIDKKCSTEKLHNDSGHLVRPPITNSGLAKKRRKFIYTVETFKPHTQGKKMLSGKMDLSPRSPDFEYKTSVKQLGQVQDEADCCIIGRNEIQKQENFTQESVPPSVQAKVQDLDMSQLCRDFEEEFTQMSDISKLRKVAEALPQNCFSPSACLSAMKQMKQKERQANWDGISNRRHPASNPNFSINGPTVSDSGFQSTVADLTHVTTTSFVLHSSENNTQSESGFEANPQKTASILCTNKDTGNKYLNDNLQETDANLYSAIKESQILDSGTESGLHKESTSTQLPWSAERTVDNINCILLNGQVNVGLSEKTIVSLPSICAPGSTMASNKGIEISSANLERVKYLFAENEAERTFNEQPSTSARDTVDAHSLRNGSVKGITSKLKSLPSEICSNISCQLTASQKADVTELCTLLEEADSQFEFTQFRAAKLKPHCEDAASLQRVEKELDPDFLTGIDFDDSFTLDAEKQTVTTVMPDKPDNSEINRRENKNSLTLDVGIKTVGGNGLRGSKQHVSKARALFADLEEDLKDQKSLVRQSSEIYAKTEHSEIAGLTNEDAVKGFETSNMNITTCQSRFQMSSGKGISVSAKALQEAGAFLKNCSILDSSTDILAKHKQSIQPLPGGVRYKENPPELKNVQEVKGNISKEPVEEFENNFENTPALTNANSFNDNWSLTVKQFSSTSNTTLKDIGSCATSELNISCGFSTASGKKVSLPADAMKKAGCLLKEINAHGETRKQLKEEGDNFKMDYFNQSRLAPSKNGGFQTASGKGVVISSAALKKAKSLLNECETVEDNFSVKPTYSKMPVPDPPRKNCGFLAASGKPVALSAEAIQKAKALFSDIDLSPKIPAVSDTRGSVKLQDNAAFSEINISDGVRTASEKNRSVSNDTLTKANSVLGESVAFEDTNKKLKHCDDTLPPQTAGFQTASGKGVAVSYAALKKAKILLSECSNSSGESGVKQVYSTIPIPGSHPGNSGFHAASGKPVALSDSDLQKPLKNISTCTFNEISSAARFCTASWKNVSKSDDTMANANCLLKGNSAFEDTNNTLPTQISGFQTASCKGIAFSSAALKKAKILLSECEGVKDEIGVKPTHSQMPFSGPLPENSGFHGSIGLPGALSFESIQNAKALFSDIPAVSETRKTDRYDGAQNSTQVIHCGFTTAGGAKVNVSQKSLTKAKNLLKEFDGGDCCVSDLHSKSPRDTRTSDQEKLKEVIRTSTFSITDISDVSNEENVLQACQSFPSLQETGHENQTLQILDSSVHSCISINKEPTITLKCKEDKTTTLELASVLDHGVTQAIFNKGPNLKRTEESSFFTCQSLHLSGCTERPQKILAQEALDCTKALLEDEGLADRSLSETLENVPLQENPKSNKTSVEELKGRGKRSAEGRDMTGQPPLKRRLLEEFDRTVDGARHPRLHPVKTCPNGIMNDRGVFKYSDSLYPNIIKPHRNGKYYVETSLQKTTTTQQSTQGAPKSACSKMPVFVPPFHKNTKTQTLKNTVLTDNKRTPAFIPPFKKQRTIVQESALKAQEEDLHHHPFVTKSNTNKIKDDIETVALAYSTHDNQMTNQNLPVGCGSEDSGTETLGVEDLISRDKGMSQVLESVELARDMQDMRIRKKLRQTIRPLPGSLFLTKTSGVARISLKAAVNGKPPARFTQRQLYGYGVQQHVSEITSETAEDFRFNLQQFFNQESFKDNGGVQLADGGWLVTSNDGTAGKEEFYRALCDTPGVDPKLMSKEWVYNHYRWIVWKQASIERCFPETMGSLCLTPEQVLLQLKYRYDVEVDHCRRPALRKIVERDDTASKTLVLCVCGVVSRGQSQNGKSCSDIKTPQDTDAKRGQVENPSAIIWLTDGWYAIKAELDEPLTAMLRKGRLAIGGKLIIHGAQLVGSQDACSPLEAPESLMLKICANSSRPARWDIKLGFYKDPRPFLLPVSCLYSSGGPVGCVDIIVLRSYPMQWMERKTDGGIVFRSVRAEEKEARQYNSHKHKAMEMLFVKIQAEFEREEKGNNKSQHRRRTMSRQEISSMQDGEELYEVVGDDPAYLEAHLSEQQLETLQTYRHSLMEKKQSELQDRYRRALEAEDNEASCLKRDVTPVWRLCVADSLDHHGSVYQLNLWRPSSDLQSLLKEGCRYKVFNLTTSDGKKHSGIGTIQLTGTNKTQFQDLQTSQEWLSARFQPRVSTSFMNLYNTEFQPLCGEVDLTGCVISIIDEKGSSPAFYLVDGTLNFVKVRCFNSLAQSGVEDVVKTHVFLALSNLQLRGQSTSPTPVVYAGDLTVFSANPKEIHLQESLSQLKNLIQAYENFYLVAEEKLSYLIKSDGLRSVSSPALQPQTSASVTDRSQGTNTSVIFQQPARNLGSFTPLNRNLPRATSSTEKDPRSLKRRRALDYLSRIPSPPSLSYLSSADSPCVNKTFNPPRRAGTPSTLKTLQTPSCKPVSSPVEDEWVNDEELAMIDTQALHVDVDT